MVVKRLTGAYRMNYTFKRTSKIKSGRNVSVRRTTFFQDANGDAR